MKRKSVIELVYNKKDTHKDGEKATLTKEEMQMTSKDIKSPASLIIAIWQITKWKYSWPLKIQEVWTKQVHLTFIFFSNKYYSFGLP